jgi:hypothetical protein
VPISNALTMRAPLSGNNPGDLAPTNQILLRQLGLRYVSVLVDVADVLNIFRAKLRGIMRFPPRNALWTHMGPVVSASWASRFKAFRERPRKCLIPFRLAIFRGHVPHIVFMSSKKEVERVYASRCIAFMEYELIDGTYSIPKEVGHSMGANRPMSDAKLSVPTFCGNALPQPALRIGWPGKTPKLLRLLWRNGRDGTISSRHGMNLVARFVSSLGSLIASTVCEPFALYHGGMQCPR